MVLQILEYVVAGATKCRKLIWTLSMIKMATTLQRMYWINLRVYKSHGRLTYMNHGQHKLHPKRDNI